MASLQQHTIHWKIELLVAKCTAIANGQPHKLNVNLVTVTMSSLAEADYLQTNIYAVAAAKTWHSITK